MHYDGRDEPVLCGEPIELIHENIGGKFFALVSLNPNGELRWYKALYGTFIYYSSLSDTTFEESVDSKYDVFFAKFGFPIGAPTAWPQHPSVSAVEHYLLNKIILFPNPVQNTINLESEATPMTMVCIYDLTGRKVVQHPCFSSHSVNINLSHIPRGMYIARIFTHAGVVERKFVKSS